MASRRKRKQEKIILYTADEIQKRIAELGKTITRDYRKQFSKNPKSELVLVGVLKGCCLFLADLSRQIDLPVTIDFIRASSYGDDTKSSGLVRIDFDPTQPITGKHTLIVEDIVDTGLTLQKLRDHLLVQKPRSLKVCALLNKRVRRQVPVKVNYVGFNKVPDEFLVGYGLDDKGLHRNDDHVWFKK